VIPSPSRDPGTPDPVLAGLRAYMGPVKSPSGHSKHMGPRATGWPRLVLLIDTETSIDAIQRLRIGTYRLCQWVGDDAGGATLECIEEGVFYGDDLPARDLAVLRAYAKQAVADAASIEAIELTCYSRREFVERVLWRAVREGRALICGFNLPFDLSRLAVGWGNTRPRDELRLFARGFSLQLWDYPHPQTGKREEHPFRPRLLIRHIDSKRARFAWGSCQDKSMWDGSAKQRQRYRGHFLDLKTLTFALTGASHSLASAARTFHVTDAKSDGLHGAMLTSDYIDYNRQDVRVTQGLLEALRGELDRHPIDADPWQLHSPASLAKAYLRALGISPMQARARHVPARVHGAAMEAYYGGRTEMHIVRTPVPVVYTDFTSMYPTVQALARLDQWITATSLRAESCTSHAQRILASVSADACLDPSKWPNLRFFARVLPADDILPLRAQYAEASDNFVIGLNRVTSSTPMWYSGFDLAASVLLTGTIPRILEAVILRPRGTIALRTVALRGHVALDPSRGNVFRTLVEMRHAVSKDPTLSDADKRRLAGVLKVIANSGSYGIFAEMNPQDLPDGEQREVEVVGGSHKFTAPSTKPEQAGEYCFPPIASLVTGAARLLLALLETLVRDHGGTYAMCDTDSMAIVATETGGFVPCPGGPELGPSGEPGITALSWAQVRTIIGRLNALKPYGPEVADSLLKMEGENFVNGQQVPLLCFGISAKRYCLYRNGPSGPDIVKASEHGLGHLLNPTDPDEGEGHDVGTPPWIHAIWAHHIAQSTGELTSPLPAWFARPAVARHGFSSPALLRPAHKTQSELAYADQLKPFNFALTAYLTLGGAPEGTELGTCHLVGPFERNARKWTKQNWHDTHSGQLCRIACHASTSPHVARVKSIANVVSEHGENAESKSARLGGWEADGMSVGLLARRHVTPLYFFSIGKESNRLEAVERGEIRSLADVQEMLEDPKRTFWATICLPRLNAIPARELAAETGIAESLIIRYRKGEVKPGPANLKRLIGALRGRLGTAQTNLPE
jgi:hypothetical protein